MALLDYNTNIMLDLETTSLAPNPCLLEIGAIHFDLNTGRELSTFSSIISLSSCQKAGLHTDPETWTWLLQNIPETLEKAQKSDSQLSAVLTDFAAWVCKCHNGNGGRQIMLWGNGAFSDNRWVESAFIATGLKYLMPWRFWGHMCVRTFVKQIASITGRDYAREVPWREGRKHVAIDDCRHQVRYLVFARRSVVPAVAEGGLPDAAGRLPWEIDGGKEEVGTWVEWLEGVKEKLGKRALSLGEMMAAQREWKAAVAAVKGVEFDSDEEIESSPAFQTQVAELPPLTPPYTLQKLRARELQVKALKKQHKEEAAKKEQVVNEDVSLPPLTGPITLEILRVRESQLQSLQRLGAESAQIRKVNVEEDNTVERIVLSPPAPNTTTRRRSARKSAVIVNDTPTEKRPKTAEEIARKEAEKREHEELIELCAREYEDAMREMYAPSPIIPPVAAGAFRLITPNTSFSGAVEDEDDLQIMMGPRGAEGERSSSPGKRRRTSEQDVGRTPISSLVGRGGLLSPEVSFRVEKEDEEQGDKEELIEKQLGSSVDRPVIVM